jgi:hypothetical protein
MGKRVTFRTPLVVTERPQETWNRCRAASPVVVLVLLAYLALFLPRARRVAK